LDDERGYGSALSSATRRKDFQKTDT